MCRHSNDTGRGGFCGQHRDNFAAEQIAQRLQLVELVM
jgi:hypothetical protein